MTTQSTYSVSVAYAFTVMCLLTVSLLSTTVSAQAGAPIPPSPGHPQCSICGPGNTIDPTKANTIVQISGQDPVSCANMERAGANGFIQAAFCPAIPALVTVCNCIVATTTSAPITLGPTPPSDTPMPTPFPTAKLNSPPPALMFSAPPTPAPVPGATPLPTITPVITSAPASAGWSVQSTAVVTATAVVMVLVGMLGQH